MAPVFPSPHGPKPYSSGEVAALLGRSIEWFYDHRQDLHAKGLPPPLDLPGQRRFPRAQVDAWLSGNDRRALANRPPLEPANDAAPVPAGEDESWQTYVRQHYAGAGR